MFSLRVIVGLSLVVWSTASSVVFEESPSTSNDNTNVGTRNGPFDDSVVIEAAGSPSGGDVDSRFFGLLGGGNRPFGGGGFGGGYPIGATKPGRCPGLLGLGLGQPEGGYGGYGGYGGGYPGGYGGYPGGYGGYPGGYGGYGNHHHHHRPGGYGYPGQYGYGGGFNNAGFRSADQGGENGDKTERRKRSDEANKETDASVQGRSGGETDPRFLGAIGGLLGNVTCSAYALPQLDTIDSVTGGIDKDSVLNLVVFGDLEAHLELMDDVVIDLLHAKWNTFIKFRFYRCFFLFALYFAISLICFTVRPGPPTRLREEITTTPIYTTTDMTWPSSSFPSSEMPMSSTTYWPTENDTIDPSTYDDWNGTVTDPTKPLRTDPTIPITSTRPRTTSNPVTSSVSPKSGHKHVPVDACILQHYDPTIQGYARMVGEAGVLIGVVLYLGAAAREARFLGRKMFFENLATAPSRVLFLISCMLVIAMVFLRWFCLRDEEDIVAVLVMLSTAPYFLFFCRGFKKVGPFVVMIYRMIMGDLLRFVTIYVVFVMGFSQAYYIVFLTHPPNREHAENPMPSPVDSVMMMFLMSLYNFGGTYEAFARTEHETVAKILFVIYMAIVGILLINMLIAMMGNTYTKIAETRNEWQRQWARIVLVVERGVDPKSRLENQVLYSQPMVDGRRAFMLRQQQSVEDLEEMKELDDIRTTHKRSVARRAAKLAEAQAAAKAGTNGSACPPPLITQNATLPITKTQF